MGASDALDLMAMLRDVDQVLAIELLVATQALELRQRMLAAAAQLAADERLLAGRIERPQQLPADAEACFQRELAILAGDLRGSGAVHAAAPATAVLAAVRRAGIGFLEYDRAGGRPETAVRLVRDGSVVAAAEACLESPLHG